MSENDRIYFAQRAAEEEQLASSASDPSVVRAHQRMQRAYLERASTGARPQAASEPIS
jgi:hypothetical protein